MPPVGNATTNIIDVLEHVDELSSDLTDFVTMTKDETDGYTFDGEAWPEYFGPGIQGQRQAEAWIEQTGLTDDGTIFAQDLGKYGFGVNDISSTKYSYLNGHLTSMMKQMVQAGLGVHQMRMELQKKMAMM